MELTQELLIENVSYDPETGVFLRKISRGGAKAGDVAGYLGKNGYWYISIVNHEYLAHRLAYLYMTGNWPENQIDHINRIPRDNRFSNLRPATQTENNQNFGRRRDNTSGHPGVYWHKPTKNWTAMIFRKGKCVSLGYFDSIDGAIAARRKAVAENYVASGPA